MGATKPPDGIADALLPALSQLRHGYRQIVQGIGDPVGIAQGIIGPEIARLERLVAQSQQRGDDEDVKDRWTIDHQTLVKLIRDLSPEYRHGQLSVSFRIERLTGGANGGAIIGVDVEVHGA